MSGLETHQMLFEGLDVLAHGLFRLRLAGFGIGLSPPFPICVGGFFGGHER